MNFLKEIGKNIKKEDLIFMPVMNKLDRTRCIEFVNKLKGI